MGEITFILGGARSGKSSFAVKLAKERSSRVAYIATASPTDEEIIDRINIHKSSRPKSWLTIEKSENIADAINDLPTDVNLVLIDCLTYLTFNILKRWQWQGEIVDARDAVQAESAVTEEATQILSSIKRSCADFILISNEIGLGLVPPYPLGRVFRDVMGRFHQMIAANSREVYMVFAGIPMRLK
ncbi:MAG: bifunctional adenosylcobinamide kinase/adenosylcobinamide-phosphate guanylyltransferase [Actinobacteria bacterium]|nr:bifunctional adenosylcobinamide kinase/adenosylcobinamide-phosphate guanylyltransferase [Actinomycetota bacterium]